MTHSWRKIGAKIGNTVVKASSKSNHLVGRAIDFNLDRPGNRRCGGACIKSEIFCHFVSPITYTRSTSKY